MGHKLLLVEDDRHFAKQLALLLQGHGHEVLDASEGGEALELFDERHPDLVIVEMMLPDTTGPGLVDALRAFPGGADVPVLLMSQTYHSGASFEEENRRLGVLGFLHKPFSVSDLARSVDRILALPESGRAAVRRRLAGEAAEGPEKPARAEPKVPSAAHAAGPERRPPGSGPAYTTAEVELATLGRPAASFPPRPAIGRAPDGHPAVASGPPQPPTPERTPGRVEATRTQQRRRLDPVRYVETVSGLFHAKDTGVLRLVSTGATWRIFFLNGYPVWADADPARLGCVDYLCRRGRITPEQAGRIADRQVRLGWSTQRVLVAMQILGVQEMDGLLQGWVEDALTLGLTTGGEIEFESGDRFAGEIPVYEVNPIPAIWTGVQRTVRLGQAEVGLAFAEGRFLTRRRTHDRLFGYIATTPVLAELRDWLSDSRQFDSIRDYFAQNWEEVSRGLWMLVHSGVVKVTSEPAEDTGAALGLPPGFGGPVNESAQTMRFDRETVDAMLRGVPGAVEAPDLADPEVRVIHDYVSRMDLDHYAFLGVSRNAGREEIERAYQELAPAYRPAQLGSRLQGDTRRKAKELLARLVRAWETLSDPARRRLYDEETLAAPAPAGSLDGDPGDVIVEMDEES